jgi:capsule polysaccharide export protein KpsC/LpsZ
MARVPIPSDDYFEPKTKSQTEAQGFAEVVIKPRNRTANRRVPGLSQSNHTL